MSEEEPIKVRVQKMFPNCSKYKSCCDTTWNKNLENVKDLPVITMKPVIRSVFDKIGDLWGW